jgi:hypothetical protein
MAAMFRPDYLLCLLTIVSTILIGRKIWAGFVLAGFNSLLLCFIGWETHQTGLVPANIFCILVYGFSIRSWIRGNRTNEWLRDTRMAEAEDARAGGQNPAPGSSGKGARIIPFPVGRRLASPERLAKPLVH